MTTKKEKCTVKIGAAVLKRHKDGIKVKIQHKALYVGNWALFYKGGV